MQDIKETTRNFDEKDTNPLGDPFAVDFFGTSVSEIEELSYLNEDFIEKAEVVAEPDVIQLPKKVWADDLPKINKSEFHFSNAIQFLPTKLSAFGAVKIEESLSHFIFSEPDKVKLQIVDNKEVVMSDFFLAAEKEQSVFVSLIAEPEKCIATLVLDSVFASQIVDKTLGELGLTKLVRRKLSRTEETVIEFLSICLLSNFNENLAQSLFRINTIEQHFPEWLEIKQDKENLRGMAATIRFEIGDAIGNTSFIYSTEFLQKLNQYENPLLKNYNEKDVLQKYKQIVFDLPSSLLIGSTNFTLNELGGLEQGDFIVLEESFVEWDDRVISANSYVEFADNFKVYGEIESKPDGKLFITIQDILSDKRQKDALERIKMDAEINDEFDTENEEVSVVLDNVMLNVNVVLAGRKMNLEELSRLRNGQIIELGCKATDAVELQTDGKKIAVGDLIDIEGNLGVRLTKVFV
jgi:flagellar motor switch/type III secretory pathway protein FliN